MNRSSISNLLPNRQKNFSNLLAGVVLSLLSHVPSAFAGQGTASYLDFDGTNPGFGTAANTSESALVWSTSAGGTAATTARPTSTQITIGALATDFAGAAPLSVALDGGGNLQGVVINSTNVNVTFTCTSANNTHNNSSPNTWTITNYATLTMNCLRQSLDLIGTGAGVVRGLNWNNIAVTFTGPGTINFATPFGCNSASAVQTMNMPGGTIIISNAPISPSSTSCSYKGGFTLTAGTLNFASAGSIYQFSGLTNGQTLSINGGAIDNTSGSPLVLQIGTLSGNLGGIVTLGGNFTFIGSSNLDLGTVPVSLTGNRTVTVNASTLAIGGAITNSTAGFGITKAGSGTLMLYGTNTYSGPTTLISAGTLALTNTGSITSSPLVVSNSTFDVSGLTIQASLSTAGLSNSTLVVAIPSTSFTNVLPTTLNVGGTTNIVNIASLPQVTSYPQTFHILKATTVNGTLNFGLGTLPSASPAYTGYITNIPLTSSVDFVLTGGPVPVRALKWRGINNNTSLADGTWDVGTTPTWLDSGNSATTYNQLDQVTFNDTATGQTNINLTTALTPGTLVVSNNTLRYTFASAGGSLGNGVGNLVLNKQGSGTLVLQESGDNFSGGIDATLGTVIIDNDSSTISGGTTIGAGATVQLGNNDTAGILPTGTVVDNGTLAFKHTDDITVANSITGGGAVNHFNANTVTLSGANSGGWSANIQNGTLKVSDNTSLGSLPGGAVNVSNGGTLDIGGNGTQNNANYLAKQINIAGVGVNGNGAIVNSGPNQQQNAFQNVVLTADATIGGPSRWDIRGGTNILDLAGHTLIKTNANQTSLVSTHVTSGNIVIAQGIMSFETAMNFDTSSGTITVSNGAYLGQFRLNAGSFTRNVVLNGGGTTNLGGNGQVAQLDAPILLTANSTIGNAGGTVFFNGAISDGGSGYTLSQYGVGTNTLSATNTYIGNTYLTSGTLSLTNRGSISNSPLIVVTNGAAFDESGLSGPLSGPNTLQLGSDTDGVGNFIVGKQSVSNFNTIILNNAAFQIAVGTIASPSISMNTLNLGDGTMASTINITSLPLITPTQFTLIKYASSNGTYNLNLGSLPSGYSATLVNNFGNNSIDLNVTAIPSGTWNGASSTSSLWSDSANWNNVALLGTDPLFFLGSSRLNNTNDTGFETANGITFFSGAGAFVLNGNGVNLSGGVTNSSSNLQDVDLGLSFGGNGTNITFDGGSPGLILGGGLTNTLVSTPGWTTTTLAGNGTLTNTLNSSTSPGGTNIILLNSSTANWTLADNPASAPMTVPWILSVNNGTFNFGSGSSAPNLSTISVNGSPNDNQAGTVSGATGTFNMNTGTFSTVARLNTATGNSSTGIVNQVGGTLNIGQQFQGANGGTTNAQSTVNLSGGTMNIGGGTGQFYVASRDQGILTVSANGILNCGNLDVSRDAQGNTRGSVGTVNLNGGIATVSRVGTATANSQSGPPTSGVNPSATFNFNGGTLKARAASPTWFQGNAASPAIPITTIVKSGGAIIDDGGFAVSVLEPMQHDSSLGGSPDGGLKKLGAGTLTLGAANTYTGPTSVSNGTLAVSGSLGATAVTVATNGTLAGISGGATVTVQPGGTLSPAGPGAIGTISVVGNVILQGTNYMDINQSLGTQDIILITGGSGSISYGGTLVVNNLAGTLTSSDSFKLFNGNSYSGTFAALIPPTPGNGLVWNTNTLTTDGKLRIASLPIITTIVSGTQLKVSWPADHLGWHLQAQTNPVGSGLSTTWTTIPGTDAGTNYTTTIDPSRGSVFYRLIYP